MLVNSLSSHKYSVLLLHYPDFTDEEHGVQRGWEICPSKCQVAWKAAAPKFFNTTAFYTVYLQIAKSSDLDFTEGGLGHANFNSCDQSW